MLDILNIITSELIDDNLQKEYALDMIRHMESGISCKGLGLPHLLRIKNLAVELGVKGAVFTRADGSIKVVAEGEEVNLIEFAEKLKGVGGFREIENFYVKWQGFDQALGNFYIINN